MLSSQRLLIFVGSHEFRNVIDVVTRRIWIGVEGVKFMVLWHFGDDIFEAVLPLMLIVLFLLFMFRLKGPLLFFFFFLQIPLHICDLMFDKIKFFV